MCVAQWYTYIYVCVYMCVYTSMLKSAADLFLSHPPSPTAWLVLLGWAASGLAFRRHLKLPGGRVVCLVASPTEKEGCGQHATLPSAKVQCT